MNEKNNRRPFNFIHYCYWYDVICRCSSGDSNEYYLSNFDAGISNWHIDGAMDYDRIFAGFSHYYSGIIVSETEIYHQSFICDRNDTFMIGTVLSAITPVFSLLLLGRLIQGVGTGVALPLMFNIVLEQVPKKTTGLDDGCGFTDYRYGTGYWPFHRWDDCHTVWLADDFFAVLLL